MNAVNSNEELLLDRWRDVPPSANRFNEYVERELQERTRAAYERGVDRGSKYRLGALMLGLVLGWIAGLGLRIIG